MSTELVTTKYVEAVLARITNPMTSHTAAADLATGLTDPSRYTPMAARSLMEQLPHDLQVVVVVASASELEVSNVIFLPPDRVVSVIAHDLVLHEHLSDLQQQWRIFPEDADRARTLKARFCFEMTDRSTGEKKTVMIRLDPCRAFAYLSSIVTHKDDTWIEEAMEGTGVEILAYLLKAEAEGVLQVDEDIWEDFLENAKRTNAFERASRLAREDDLDSLEESLLDAHHRALCDELANVFVMEPMKLVELTLDDADFPGEEPPPPHPRGDVIDIG